jgi:hypothetical protein
MTSPLAIFGRQAGCLPGCGLAHEALCPVAHDRERIAWHAEEDRLRARVAELEAERDGLLRHLAGARKEHNVLALLDSYHERATAAEARVRELEKRIGEARGLLNPDNPRDSYTGLACDALDLALRPDAPVVRDAVAARPLVYLACPYSHDDRAVRVARFEAASAAAGKLMQDGLKVFSPISHTHTIAEMCALPLGWDFWEAFDRAFIGHSHKLIVLRVEGWRESKGVSAEIGIAQELGIPVEYMEPTRDHAGEHKP